MEGKKTLIWTKRKYFWKFNYDQVRLSLEAKAAGNKVGCSLTAQGHNRKGSLQRNCSKFLPSRALQRAVLAARCEPALQKQQADLSYKKKKKKKKNYSRGSLSGFTTRHPQWCTIGCLKQALPLAENTASTIAWKTHCT